MINYRLIIITFVAFFSLAQQNLNMILQSRKEKEVSFMRYKLRPVSLKVLYKKNAKVSSKNKKKQHPYAYTSPRFATNDSYYSETISKPKGQTHSSHTLTSKVNLKMDSKEFNPVYKYLDSERNKKNVLGFLLSSAFNINKKTSSNNQIRNTSYSPNFKVFLKQKRSNTCNDLDALQTKGQNFYQKVGHARLELKKKKKKINLLQKYNDTIERYCKFIPQNFEEQNEKEMLIAHEEVRKLCNEKLFKEDNPSNRAEEIKEYYQPEVPPSFFFRKKQHRKVNTVPSFLSFNDTLSAKNHTLQF